MFTICILATLLNPCKNKILVNHKILLLFAFLFSLSSIAQEAEDPYGRDLKSLTLKKRGLNSDHYSHLFVGYGLITGEDRDSAELRYGRSSTFTFGYLWKWRITNWAETGFDLAYHYSSFHLKQDSSKIVPNRQLHKREKLVFNALQLSPFLRFKLRNRQSSNGTFIDLGGFVGYQFRVANHTVERNRAPGAGKTRTINVDLDYKRDYSYGALARIGFNRVIFYGRCRLSELFTEESNLPDLPKYELGLKIGIHQ